MRSHCAIYIDAGYLLSASATRAAGTSLRSSIHVEYGTFVRSLSQQAEQMTSLPVLRSYWYDSARDGVPDAQQSRIGELDRVKLRLGRFGMDGQQKGVDLRIGLDLVNHARRRTADVFILVSGDDDLSEAVEEAQAHGVQVVVMAVPTREGKPQGVSRHLVRAADLVALVDAATLDAAVLKVQVPEVEIDFPRVDEAPKNELNTEPETSPHNPLSDAVRSSVDIPVPTPNDLLARPRRAVPSPPRSIIAYSTSSTAPSNYGAADRTDHEATIKDVATRVLAAFRASATTEDLAGLFQAQPSVPRDIDRALLMDLSDALGVYDVPEPIRYRARQVFWEIVDGSSAIASRI